jgi:2-furoate---CoA ligase
VTRLRLWRSFELAVERFPDRPAIWAVPDRQLTYAQWFNEIERVAGGLSELGVLSGDRVAVGMRNTIAHATVHYAAQAIGACAVPFNHRLKPAGLDHILRDSGSVVTFVDDAVPASTANALRAEFRDMRWVRDGGETSDFEVSFHELDSGSSRALDIGHDDDALSAIIYTSGTTGTPKGVPVSQRSVYERILTHATTIGPRFDDGTRTFGASPLYHTVGLHWVLYYTMFVNGTYYPISRLDESAVNVLRDQRLTYMHGPPTLYRMLISHLEPHEVFDSVEEIVYGSAPSDWAFLKMMYQRFPRAVIHEGYGTTELSIPFMTSTMAGRAPGTLRLAADQRVRLVEAGGDIDAVVAPDELGELLVDMSNPGVFTHYWGAAEHKTADKVDRGWFRTGDMFRRDDDGNYFFVGRLDDMFVSGGENVQPAEVEGALLTHPSIDDVAVVGMPDADWGCVIVAAVVCNSETCASDLDAHCLASDLDDFKRPRRYVFVSEIPRNPSGKVLRAEVRERINSNNAAPA